MIILFKRSIFDLQTPFSVFKSLKHPGRSSITVKQTRKQLLLPLSRGSLDLVQTLKTQRIIFSNPAVCLREEDESTKIKTTHFLFE